MRRKSSIVILSTHKVGGGAFVAASNFADEFKAAGWNTLSISLNRNRSIDNLIFWLNILMDRVLKYVLGYSNPIFHSSNLITRYGGGYVDGVCADIANIHWFSNGLISVSSVAKLKTPYVLTFHDSWLVCGMEHHPGKNGASNNKFDKYLIREKAKVLENARGYIFPSQWQADLVMSRSLHEKPYLILPNFCEIEKELLNINGLYTPNLFTIGLVASRLFDNASKGGADARVLVEGLSSMASDLKVKIRVVIAGKRSESVPVDFNSEWFSIEQLGELSRSNMVKFYAELDSFVNLSHFENLSTTNVEAQASAVPVICYDVGGNSETIMDGATGYLVKERAVEEVLNRLCDLISHPERTANMGADARVFFIDKFAKKNIISRFVEFLEVVGV